MTWARRLASRRFAALATSAALLASLAVSTAAPVGAADEVTCKGVVATIVGTQGPDVLVGTNGRDIIAGLGGDDVIKGLGGPDLICAGRGADRVKGNQGRDRLYGNAGPDKLFGGKGPDTLEGGVSDDMLKGQKGADALDGGPGTDTCYQDLGSGSETGCELPEPEPTFQSVCEDTGGTYSSRMTPAFIAYEHYCSFAAGSFASSPEVEAVADELEPFCSYPPIRVSLFPSDTSGDGSADLYCPLPIA